MLRTPCDDILLRLDAFHDGELPVDEQVMVRTHVELCASCAAQLDDYDRMQHAFRVGSARCAHASLPPEGWTTSVVEQARVERSLSWHAWVLGVFDDMHLVWPALGATAAVLVCLLGSAHVLQATNELRPDSLAGVIDYLASPGSNDNPARIDGFTVVPKRVESPSWPLMMTDGDAVLALSAVVTREGRIRSVEMIAAEQARALHVRPDVVLAMLDAASRAQFEPARAGGAPIAVSMVWVLAQTTVVGKEADLDRLSRPLTSDSVPAAGQGPAVQHPRPAKPVA